MNISIKKDFICSILFVSFFLTGCSTNRKNEADEIVIKIGTVTVDRQQYENQLKKLTTIQDELTREKAALFLLDNYISAGLLIETAKKLNYEQLYDFIKKDSIHKEQLVIKYSKCLRTNTNKVHRVDESIIKKMLQNEIRMDYVRIPKKYKEVSKSMLIHLRNGMSSILYDKERATWDRNGLSFYSDISLKHAIVTNKVVEELMTMQNNEVKIINDKSAYYVVRLSQSMKRPATKTSDNELVWLNQRMAQSLESGDTIFDPYRLEKSIKCNENLLSKIDFSIAPFYTDSGFVAKINERFVSENDIKEKISELPVKIQCLFKNRSTRIKAVATLVLLNYYREEKKPENTNAWLQPHTINGYNQLKLNFERIEKMEIIQKSDVDDQILAYSDNWSMSVKDLKKELDKLNPITRFDIADNNLLHEMIEYVAKRDCVQDSDLIVNSDFFEYIDIIGKSHDQLNYVFDENTIVGTLSKIDLSVRELRGLVVQLCEFEKNKFMELSTRKESFNELIIKKFWLYLYDRKIIEDNPDFKKEISTYQNKLLVELLYENKLRIKSSQIDDEQLNLKMVQTIRTINEDKLFSYIQAAMQDCTIQVNRHFFRNNLNLDIGSSKYNEVIIENIN
jgi:hypothetical protein